MIASYLDDGDCIVHKCVTIYDACKKWGQTDGQTESLILQSGRCSPAKHGDAYFSAVCGSIQDPIAAPGPYENQEF